MDNREESPITEETMEISSHVENADSKTLEAYCHALDDSGKNKPVDACR